MKKAEALADELAEEIISLFGSGDTWQVYLSGDRAEGCEGLMGLHLSANCLNEHFDEEAMPTRPWKRPAGGQPEGRPAQVRKALKRLARRGPWFVACYR